MVLSICLLICNLLFWILVPSPDGLGSQEKPKGVDTEQYPGAGRGKNLSDTFSLTSRSEPIYI